MVDTFGAVPVSRTNAFFVSLAKSCVLFIYAESEHLNPEAIHEIITARLQELAEKVNSFLVVEMSNGQMIDDVRLAVEGKKPVHFHNRMGGFVPTAKEVREKVVTIMR